MKKKQRNGRSAPAFRCGQRCYHCYSRLIFVLLFARVAFHQSRYVGSTFSLLFFFYIYSSCGWRQSFPDRELKWPSLSGRTTASDASFSASSNGHLQDPTALLYYLSHFLEHPQHICRSLSAGLLDTFFFSLQTGTGFFSRFSYPFFKSWTRLYAHLTIVSDAQWARLKYC